MADAKPPTEEDAGTAIASSGDDADSTTATQSPQLLDTATAGSQIGESATGQGEGKEQTDMEDNPDGEERGAMQDEEGGETMESPEQIQVAAVEDDKKKDTVSALQQEAGDTTEKLESEKMVYNSLTPIPAKPIDAESATFLTAANAGEEEEEANNLHPSDRAIKTVKVKHELATRKTKLPKPKLDHHKVVAINNHDEVTVCARDTARE